MTLDNEKQKKILLLLIENASFSGKALEEAYELKKAVKAADVMDCNSPQQQQKTDR